MGAIYAIKCEKCGYSRMFPHEQGMWFWGNNDYEHIMMLPEEEGHKRKYKKKTAIERVLQGCHGKEIRRILKAHPIEEWNISDYSVTPYPFYCPQCRSVTPRKTAVIWRRTGETTEEHTVPQICYVCKSELISAEELNYIENIKCPHCGDTHATFKFACVEVCY